MTTGRRSREISPKPPRRHGRRGPARHDERYLGSVVERHPVRTAGPYTERKVSCLRVERLCLRVLVAVGMDGTEIVECECLFVTIAQPAGQAQGALVPVRDRCDVVPRVPRQRACSGTGSQQRRGGRPVCVRQSHPQPALSLLEEPRHFPERPERAGQTQGNGAVAIRPNCPVERGAQLSCSPLNREPIEAVRPPPDAVPHSPRDTDSGARGRCADRCLSGRFKELAGEGMDGFQHGEPRHFAWCLAELHQALADQTVEPLEELVLCACIRADSFDRVQLAPTSEHTESREERSLIVLSSS